MTHENLNNIPTNEITAKNVQLTEWRRNIHRKKEHLRFLEESQYTQQLTALAEELLAGNDNFEAENIKATRNPEGLSFYYYYPDIRQPEDEYNHKVHEYSPVTFFSATISPDHGIKTATRYPTHEFEAKTEEKAKLASSPEEAEKIREDARIQLSEVPEELLKAYIDKLEKDEVIAFGEEDFLISSIDITSLPLQDYNKEYDEMRNLSLLISRLQAELILKANLETTELINGRRVGRRELDMRVRIPDFLNAIGKYPVAMEGAVIRLFTSRPKINKEQDEEVFEVLKQIGLIPEQGRIAKFRDQITPTKRERLKLNNKLEAFKKDHSWHLQYSGPITS